jgi:hypothetical protein
MTVQKFQTTRPGSTRSAGTRSAWKKPAIVRMAAGVAEFGGSITADGLGGQS